MPFRWGILGLGAIARKFATGLQSANDAELVAVGSRTQEKADAFGADFNAPHRHGSYEALVADPDVDAIYVATPHPMHREDALLCVRHGKHLLLEKPFTVNAPMAREVIAAAKDVFVMEAMWTRFIPAVVKVRELVAEGAIGEVRMVQADFGFRAGFDQKARLFNPELGGGALLDVGIYPVSLSSMLFGNPVKTLSLATLGETGVDEQSAYILQYAKGQLAVLSAAVRTNTPKDAFLLGTEGSIKIHAPFWIPNTITVSRNGKDPETLSVPFEGNGYNYEAEEVARCVAAGLKESPVMPLAETVSILETLDNLRAQWGLRYPME